MDSTSDKNRALIESVRASAAGRVKVAVTDIDGVVRGMVIHVDKFVAAAESGIGFNVFGFDVHDRPIDNIATTGSRFGFPDATVSLDLATYRTVPWDNDVPFFLGDHLTDDGSPHPLCPRQVLKRVLRRAEKMGLQAEIGSEFEFFNFKESKEMPSEPITRAMFGYSLARANRNQEYFNALWEESARFRIPLESLHTETGPGVYEAAILCGDALEAADRAALFKEAAKEIGARHGIMPSFMAKWDSKYPGCSGHVHQSLTDGNRNVFHDPDGRHGGMSRIFESYLAGQIAYLMQFGPLLWPTINSYKRLVEGFLAPVKATWGIDNRVAAFRVLNGSPDSMRLETRSPGADVNPYLAFAAVLAAGLAGVEQKLELTAEPVTGENVGGENVASAPRTLIETTQLFRQSMVARDWLGDEFVEYYAATREWEWKLWLDAVTDWERRRYFEII